VALTGDAVRASNVDVDVDVDVDVLAADQKRLSSLDNLDLPSTDRVQRR
jgi:hypothetical protein